MEGIKEFLKHYEGRLEDEANNIRDIAMPRLTEELFALYEQTGNRLVYEKVYFERRKYLAVFGMTSVLYHRAADIEKLEEVITDICAEECWALPAHVQRDNGSDWRIYVDLFAAETAQALAEYISALEAFISPKVYNLAKSEVFRRVLHPFYEAAAPYGSWEFCEHNWCAVCSGAIGSATLYLMSDRLEYLKQCIERICNSLEHYLSGFSPDGACMEGLGYFTYGMTYFTGFAEQLYRYTDGTVDLMANAHCARIAEFQQKCFFTGGRTLSFSDGDSNDRFKMGLTSYLAMRYPEVEIPDMRLAAEFDFDECYRSMAIYRDYFWTKEYYDKLCKGLIKQSKSSQRIGQTVLPHAQWSICQSANGVTAAIKGGHNDEPHNHNDVGSFLYNIGNEMFLSDLGAGEYKKEYFNHMRYTILCNMSLGHNVPLIDGEMQLPGKEYAADLFETDEKGKTVIEFAGAYKKGMIESIKRTLLFDIETGFLTVEDRFILKKHTTRITENLVTQFVPEIKGGNILLKGQSGDCNIQVDTSSEISFIKKQHMDHNGIPVDVYIIEWELPNDGKEAACKFVISRK